MAAEQESRLKIVTSSEGRSGEVIPLRNDVAIIGRGGDCSVVLRDGSVSSRHASIEKTPEGLRLRDLDSANGVWIEERRIEEMILRPGMRFRIGTTIFEFVAPTQAPPRARTVFLSELPPLMPQETIYGSAEAFVVRTVRTGETGGWGAETSVRARWATLGRGEDCSVILKDRDISRQHAKIELLPAGFRVTDLGSANGTWVGTRQIEKAEVLEAGQEFRLGASTVLTCELEPGESVAPVPREATVMMVTPPVDTARIQRIEDEGELVEVNSHKSFLLDDPALAWYVRSGGVDISTVTLEKGKPIGLRSHFLEIAAGQCFLGFGLRGTSLGFIAVGNQETELGEIPLDRLLELAADSSMTETVATLLDTWIVGLAVSLEQALTEDAGAEPLLEAGKETVIGQQQKVAASNSVVWIEVESGSVLYDSLWTPEFKRRRVLFPVTPHSWVESLGADEFGDLTLQPLPTAQAIRQPGFREDLRDFHDVVHHCHSSVAAQSRLEEAERLRRKGETVKDAEREAVGQIAAVMTSGGETPEEFLQTGATEPVLRACEIVGNALGIEVRPHPEATEDATYEEKVSAIARASGFRTRVVALRDVWWKKDQGPLLGLVESTTTPVAILPEGLRSYVCIDSAQRTRVKIDEEVADTLSPFAYTFYRPFPEHELSVKDVVRFGVRGLANDFRLLLAMGVIIGMFGTLVTYLTGRIFDAAIPQADRSLLLAFGIALLLSAVASAVFKLTQGIATLRIQGRMEYSIQSALWGRLLDLPTRFFSSFSAGDLADRAAGVDAIQSLVSGAGVGAILGTLSGIFYVFLMFTYDLRLTVLAIFLTLFFVGFTMSANYLQLRHQRVEITIRGKITGLVLNLINGVSKLRIVGAENHAFRVWAEKFSSQRRIAFKIGRIQNVVQVFNSIFPVISSMGIFVIMVSSQKAAAASGAEPLTTGDFIAFNAAYGLFLTSMQALGDASLSMLRVVPIYERLAPIVTTRPEVDSTKAFPGKLRGAITLSHVFFRYDKDAPFIMNDLSLEIEPGEFVAFVGGSGCGKSTLLRLLLGFEVPQKGAVLYDGQDLSTLDLRILREQIGVVLQVSKVMPAEIYRNIVGISSRTEDDAWDAAERAGLAADVRSMPMKMHTYVSEGGGTLSGGQRQRLMIARAIVNKPKILFLDEATSALDNKSQAIVSESMDQMDATRIVIAHRLSTIINADKICYLEGGKVAEMGTYQELMAQGGLFAELAERQMA
jgi:NHLM bacteriocin system ABC transporter ATP-binding protein